MEKNGLVISGVNELADLVEIVELPNHPHFIGVQFHPEFKSRPNRAEGVFATFIESSVKK